MSLASLLLGSSQTKKSTQVDDELDALFLSNPRPPVASNSIETSASLSSNVSSPRTSHARGLKRKRQNEAGIDQPPTSTNVLGPSTQSSPKRKRSVIFTDAEAISTSGKDAQNGTSLENKYLSRRTTKTTATTPERKSISHASVTDSSEVDEEHTLPPVHETHTGSGRRDNRSKTRKRALRTSPDETPAQRDARTIFVGNVPVAVVKSKSLQKQLKRHFLSLITGSIIESFRFRSVAFASATTVLSAEDSKTSSSKKGDDAISTRQQRQEDRAAQWRESLSTDRKVARKGSRKEEDEVFEQEDSHSKSKRASYLTPAERKRVAFIKGEFHNEMDTVNAYIVFAYHEASHDFEQTASRALLLHPFEAARLAVEKCDGSLFMDRTIRVDRVGQWRVGTDDGSSVGDDLGKFGDPRVTLFVGNLDFAAKEEELRVWFEGVISQERGPPPPEERRVGVAKDNIDNNEGAGIPEKHIRWVRSVRIVRDRDSQLGKGFAYVRFLDRECVDEILGLEPSKLKFAKRKLRVQRCKVAPGSTVLTKTKQSITPAVSQRAKKTAATSSVPLPKGDPSLGEKLAGLSKDERKAAKATNVDRLKRRLAKKRLKEGAKKLQGDKESKERKRERPRLRNKTDGKAKVVNKGRIRSEKSVAKRNTKK